MKLTAGASRIETTPAPPLLLANTPAALLSLTDTETHQWHILYLILTRSPGHVEDTGSNLPFRTVLGVAVRGSGSEFVGDARRYRHVNVVSGLGSSTVSGLGSKI